MSAGRPYMSVIVPVHDAEGILHDTLGALAGSDLDRSVWELIVVDDVSTDGTVHLAGEYADDIVRLTGSPHGPAFARNRGAEASRGEVLVFVDADVRVAPEALGKLERIFRGDPELAAAFGSYDDQPPAPGLVSRYRNLLHHYHHHQGAGAAETFWAGLGAVRADVYRELGGFDDVVYARPQIEDIELGRRIRRSGRRILLDPTIQGAHLKRWTLGQVLRTDLFHRGIPWMKLILGEGAGGNILNVKPKEKLCVALVGIAIVLVGVAGVLRRPSLLLAATASLAVVVGLNLPLYRYLSRGRSLGFALGVVPLHLIYYVTSGLSFILGHIAHRLSPQPARGSATRGLALESRLDDA